MTLPATIIESGLDIATGEHDPVEMPQQGLLAQLYHTCVAGACRQAACKAHAWATSYRRRCRPW